MAVPSSGELSLRKIGAEKRFDSYDTTQDGFFVGTMGQISLADVSTSGNSGGTGCDDDNGFGGRTMVQGGGSG